MKQSANNKKQALSPLETFIVQLICREFTTEEITGRLTARYKKNFSKRTVEGYRGTLLKKMKVRSSVGIALYAVKHGIIDLKK